jgi:cysteine synthase
MSGPTPFTPRPAVLDLIGNTPLVDVSMLSPNPHVRLFAKLESANPFGSVKDRVAKALIEAAHDDGSLQPGQRILEPSSGNTGIALAAIGRLYGHLVTVVLPESVSVERRQALLAFGAEVVLTPGGEGSNGAVRRARELAVEHPEWFMPFQYGNDANPRVHYTTTGPEIWAQTSGTVTHFVAGLGTSGTLMGVGRYLKEQNPAIEILAVEPPAGELVEGLRSLDDGFIPPVFEAWGGVDLLDGKRIVRPLESLHWTRRLRDLGIFAGPSSGASLAAAVRTTERLESGTVVFVVCDGGWKYLSTGAYAGDLAAASESLGEVIYF